MKYYNFGLEKLWRPFVNKLFIFVVRKENHDHDHGHANGSEEIANRHATGRPSSSPDDHISHKSRNDHQNVQDKKTPASSKELTTLAQLTSELTGRPSLSTTMKGWTTKCARTLNWSWNSRLQLVNAHVPSKSVYFHIIWWDCWFFYPRQNLVCMPSGLMTSWV